MSDRNIFLKSMQPDDEDSDGLKAAGGDIFPEPSEETLKSMADRKARQLDHESPDSLIEQVEDLTADEKGVPREKWKQNGSRRSEKLLLSIGGIGSGAGMLWESASGWNGFNILLNIVERHPENFPQGFFEVLENAKLFDINKIPADFIGSYIEDSTESEVLRYDEFIRNRADDFFLPFPITAIEDRQGCTILVDLPDTDKDGKRFKGPSMYPGLDDTKQPGEILGLNRCRGFIDITPVCPVHREGCEWLAREELKKIADHHPAGAALVVIGRVDGVKMLTKRTDLGNGKVWEPSEDEPERYAIGGRVDMVLGVTSKEVVVPHPECTDAYMKGGPGTMFPDLRPEDAQAWSERAVMNAMTALEEVMYINDPQHWIVEEINESSFERFVRKALKNKRKKRRRLPRRHERPVYTVMRPQVVRRLIGADNSEPNGEERGGGWVRAHWRTLRAPRYGKNPDGTYKRVFIKAFWRGPTEGKVKGKRYRVLTDR